MTSTDALNFDPTNINDWVFLAQGAHIARCHRQARFLRRLAAELGVVDLAEISDDLESEAIEHFNRID